MDPYVEEISRSIVKRGPMLWLVIVEICFYVVKTVKLVYDWATKRHIKKTVTERRSYRRERLERYRPECDRKHPNYAGRA